MASRRTVGEAASSVHATSTPADATAHTLAHHARVGRPPSAALSAPRTVVHGAAAPSADVGVERHRRATPPQAPTAMNASIPNGSRPLGPAAASPLASHGAIGSQSDGSSHLRARSASSASKRATHSKGAPSRARPHSASAPTRSAASSSGCSDGDQTSHAVGAASVTHGSGRSASALLLRTMHTSQERAGDAASRPRGPQRVVICSGR
eukprot:7390079-Prymnesium_polylepis.1